MFFKLKTLIGIVSIQLILLLVLTWGGLNTLRSSNEEELYKRAYSNARLVATTAQNAVLASDLAGSEALMDQVIQNPDVVYARVKGTRMTLVEEAIAPHWRKNSLPITGSAMSATAYSTCSPKVADQSFGRVEIGLSVTSLRALLDKSRKQHWVSRLSPLRCLQCFPIF